MVKIVLRGKLRKQFQKKFFPTDENKAEAEAKYKEREATERQQLTELQAVEAERLQSIQQRTELQSMIKERKRLQFQQSKLGRTISAFQGIKAAKEGFQKRKTLAQRRLAAEQREFGSLLKEREYARGDDNRYFGRHAQRWGTGAFGSKHNIAGKRKKKKQQQKKWVANDGLW